MIIVKNGEKQTVDTTSKAIEVILYFTPKENPLTTSQFMIDEEYQGSMRDKGKELIDQAREVQLKQSNYNSTRQDCPLDMAPYNKTNLLDYDWFQTLEGKNFLENKFSEVSQEKQKELNKGLAEKEVIKKLEITPEDILKASKQYLGKKETEGKSDYSEINLGILDLMAERFSANKGKYEHGNSKKPLDKQQILWALFRHVKKMVQPVENDQETFKDHLAATLTNCSILLDQLEIKK